MYLNYCDVGKKSKVCLIGKVDGVASCKNDTKNIVLKSSILCSLLWVAVNLIEINESTSERPKLFTGDDNFISLVYLRAGNSTCNHSVAIWYTKGMALIYSNGLMSVSHSIVQIRILMPG